MLREKMGAISEFQNLVEISNQKFSVFEETNIGK